MKVVFFGTPDFAVPILKKIYKSEFELSAIVTAPDKQRGRGKKISFTPVKEFGIENNIPVLQPEKFKDENFINSLKEIDADVFVVVAFRILPEEVYSLPKHGAFNLHGSLLPKYRGAAPIQWSLINGDKETGLTTFFLKSKVDTGNMILQEKIAIDEDDNFGTLHDKMSDAGSDLVLKTLVKISKNDVLEREQDDKLASPAPKITKETCKINWEQDGNSIHNLVRGLSPFPGAFFILGEKTYKVYKTKIVEKNLDNGKIEETKKEIFIGCNGNAIQILEIQPEGRKRMAADEFLRGYSLLGKN